jgi:hypothetical protein
MKRITRVPYEAEYQAWVDSLNRVDSEAYGRIRQDLDTRFDQRQVDTSSFIRVANWSGTTFEPIYWACGEDETSSALFLDC